MDEVYTFLEKTICLSSKDIIVTGVSAGPDSMALLYILDNLRKKLGFKLIVAHVNHNVRKESYQEQYYSYATEYGDKIAETNDIRWTYKCCIVYW